MFSTPIFLLLPPRPLLRRANLDGVVIVLCRVSFLFLVGVSTGDSIIFAVFGLLALLLEKGFDEFGGKEPDLLG